MIFRKVAYSFALTFQLLLITAVIVVNWLTSKKAGVMHHVYYRRYQYEQGIYSEDSLLLQSIVILILGVLLITLLFRAIKRNRSLFFLIQIGIAVALACCLIYVINSQFFIGMIAYPYFIMVIELVLAIQILVVILTSIMKRN